MPWVEDFDVNAPGVRRINFAYVGDPPPDLAVHLERRREIDDARRLRLSRRTDVPALRKPPRTSVAALAESAARVPFPQNPTAEFAFESGALRRYPTGIAFDLIARRRACDAAPLTGQIDTGRPVRVGRGGLYIGVVLPAGEVVTIKKSIPARAPEDDDTATPWLWAARTREYGGEMRTQYFVSPLPPPGAISITIAYPGAGIDSASTITIDTTRLRQLQ